MSGTGFNVARFSSNLRQYGTLQTNKFIVRIPTPELFDPSQLDPIIEYRANNVRVPGVALDLQRVFRYGVGPEQKFPTSVNFTDININFVDTQNKDIWKRFSFWFNGIFDYTGLRGGSQASYKTEYKAYYTTDIEIHVFDNDGNRISVIVLKEAFPTTLSEVGLSWSENNKLYEFSVGFAFREWYFQDYSVGTFQSGAILAPSATSSVQPRSVESPRPPASRSDPFGLNATPSNETGTSGPANFTEFNF
jgi:hypothetical protein